MKTSIDISYYPLNEEYKSPIKKFIAELQACEDITVKPNSMFTQVFGDYDTAMAAVTRCIKTLWSYPTAFLY